MHTAEKRGSDKGDTAARIKCAVATKVHSSQVAAILLVMTATIVAPSQTASLQTRLHSRLTRLEQRIRVTEALTDALSGTRWTGHDPPLVLFKVHGSEKFFAAGDIIHALPFLPIEINVPDMMAAIFRFFQQFFGQSQTRPKSDVGQLSGDKLRCYRLSGADNGFLIVCSDDARSRLRPYYITAILLPVQQLADSLDA